MDERIAEVISSGGAVVTAGRRLARHLRREYDTVQQSDGLPAWPAPAIISWAGWLDELWQGVFYSLTDPPVRLSRWQERILWEGLINDSEEAHELLQTRATAEEAAEAWGLATAWRLQLERIEQFGGADARVFAGWARSFRARCSSEGWLDDARVSDFIKDHLADLRLPQRLVLAGFDEVTPQQQDLLTACELAGCGVERIQYNQKQAGNAVRAAFADARAELTAAARWCRSLLQSSVVRKIGVVVPDLKTRRDQVERVFRGILEPGFDASRLSGLLNISAGRSLSSYPLVHSALLILEMEIDETPWDRVSAFLRSAYIAASDTERSSRAALDARVRKVGNLHVRLRDLIQLANEQRCPSLARSIGQCMTVLQTAQGSQLPSGWSKTFAQILSAVGWPGDRGLSSIEHQTARAWSGVLSDLAALDVTCTPCSRLEALGLLRSIAAEQMFQPETVDAPIQVLGLMESSGLTFDHVWVMGLHDEAWPQPADPNAFLPVVLQREIGIPHCSPEREIDFAQRLTTRLLASAPEVVFSHPIRLEDRDLSPSPLILDLRAIDSDLLPRGDDASYTFTIRSARCVEELIDEIAPPVDRSAAVRGGTRVFQFQSQCPFRAFAELRLRAEELETPVPGLDLRDRGTLVHSVLEGIWRELQTHERLLCHPDLKGLIQQAVVRVMDSWEQERGRRLPVRFRALEVQRLEQLISGWLEYEKQRDPFEVLPPEEERYVELNGIRARVKIDRIDRLPDGREILIDYKTGRPSIGDWESDRPNEPQLPLYAVTHGRSLASVLYGQIRRGEIRFLGLVDQPLSMATVTGTDLSAQLGDWRDVLESIAEGFLCGHAEADPNDPQKACRYCPLTLLARCNEQLKIEVEGA